MRLYLVVRVAQAIRDIEWRAVTREDRGDSSATLTGLQDQTRLPPYPNHGESEDRERLQGDREIYWTYSERESGILANSLAAKFPGSQWATATINSIFAAEVSKVNQRKHEPGKGVLPV